MNRKTLVFFLLVFSIQAQAIAPGKKSFSFQSVPLSEVIKTVVEKFGAYVSYDPKILKNQPPVTLKFSSSTLADALNKILADRFDYTVLDDYVVVRAAKKKAPPPSVPPVIRTKEVIVYDTIVVEETKVIYDTVEVVERRQVYDTLVVQKDVTVYDTIKIIETVDVSLNSKGIKKNEMSVYLASGYWTLEQSSETVRLPGVSLGYSYTYSWDKFHVKAGLEYNYSIQDLSYSKLETITEVVVDTVSTFFILEDGERKPRYVIESNEVSTDLIREVNKNHAVHRLSVVMAIGKRFQVNQKINIGVNAGTTLDWVFYTDKIQGDVAEEAVLIESYEIWEPWQNILIELPVRFQKKNAYEGYYIAPSGEVMIRNESIDSWFDRYRLGLKLGIFF
ncbi:STN domain-containing protein [Reichenbachiella versicolor]|uniref:STN domain-containing protein n=1 Tax=Reichenbachiella versicolor TaxID=1821036 RepID=UPI000D6E39A9|nr:STN domain-containing protein [Reichenbachiella versicolor]